MISRDLELSLNLAVSEAARRGHEFVTLEHMLYALLFNESVSRCIRACGGSVDATRKSLEDFFDHNLHVKEDRGEKPPQPTVAFQRVIQRAAQHIRSAGKEKINGENILVSMFSEHDSHAVFFLESQSVSRFDLINYVSHGVVKTADPEAEDQDDTRKDTDPEEGDVASEKRRSPLERFTTDLVRKAKKGLIDPLIGRTEELERTIQVLSRRRKNNPLFVGEAGVGKTAIAEGLALRIAEGKVPDSLANTKIFALDIGTVLAGSRYRGDFEQRIKSILSSLAKIGNTVLFIDEIHTVIGAGSVSGGTLDASNLLKPALSSGELRCIGSTTYKEFRSHFENDHALTRRFQKIDIAEPSQTDTVKILKGLAEKYELYHNVKYSTAAIKEAVSLSSRYIRDRRLPDKAIDVIDEAGAAVALARKGSIVKSITVDHIQAVVAKMAKVPQQKVSSGDQASLKDLDTTLKNVVYGQDHAIDLVVSSIRMSRSGLGNEEKPIGNFLFAGPTGVGKTELAKQLAKAMQVGFLRFDMSEYMEKHAVSRLIGAPPGYVGFDQGGQLTDAIHKNPHVVLLLDEIEKAHIDLQNILLQVMDHGTLTDSNGRQANFRNVVLIMTTNAGAREQNQKAIGFSNLELKPDELSGAIKEQFSPEFINRLDSIINFSSLSEDVVLRVVNKNLRDLEAQLAAKRVRVTVDEGARKWLAKHGYQPAFGARPMARLVQQKIKKPLANELLFGKLTKGGTVEVSVKDGQISVHIH